MINLTPTINSIKDRCSGIASQSQRSNGRRHGAVRSNRNSGAEAVGDKVDALLENTLVENLLRRGFAYGDQGAFRKFHHMAD